MQYVFNLEINFHCSYYCNIGLCVTFMINGNYELISSSVISTVIK